MRPQQLKPIAILLFALAAALHAQQPEPQQPAPYTLRVYTNLVQLPTMVLDWQKSPVQNLPRDSFRMRIDHGPWFTPTRMHIEGPEPLHLGVLLDASGTEPDLMRQAPEALSKLGSGPLNPNDRLALYAFDCTVIERSDPVLPEPQAISVFTQQLLNAPGLHGKRPGQPNCLNTSHLIDSMAGAISAISGKGDRRALIVLSDGFDRESQHTWEELRHYASSRSVPVFVIRTDTYYAPPYQMPDRRASLGELSHLCVQSGGLMLHISPRELPETLAKIVFLLRTRYILEFPRPSNATAGIHGVEVNIPKRDWTILTSGVEVKLPDDEEKNGANTIQGDRPTPQQGKRGPRGER